jgi:hypothetical protein
VEGPEEAPRDQIEDAPLVAGQLVEVDGLAGRDDGMVVAHLAVVEHAARARGRRLEQRCRERRVVGQRRQRPEQLGQLFPHVGGQVTRVRTRVGEDLVALVQRLRGRKRRRRRQAVTPVGCPLQ